MAGPPQPCPRQPRLPSAPPPKKQSLSPTQPGPPTCEGVCFMDFKSPPAISFVFVGVEGPFGDFGFFSWKGLPGNSAFFLSSKGPPAIRGGENTLLTPSPGEKKETPKACGNPAENHFSPKRHNCGAFRRIFTKEAKLWGLPANG